MRRAVRIAALRGARALPSVAHLLPRLGYLILVVPFDSLSPGHAMCNVSPLQ